MAEKHRSTQKSSKKKNSPDVCLDCPAYCCHDMAMMIPKPQTRSEIREYKWYLHYDTVKLAIRNHRWYLVVKGRCIYLDKNNMCTIYDKRPYRCRKHMPPDCEKFSKWYDTLFETPEELEEYFVGK